MLHHLQGVVSAPNVRKITGWSAGELTFDRTEMVGPRSPICEDLVVR